MGKAKDQMLAEWESTMVGFSDYEEPDYDIGDNLVWEGTDLQEDEIPF